MLFQAVVIFFAYFEFFQISCKRGKVHLRMTAAGISVIRGVHNHIFVFKYLEKQLISKECKTRTHEYELPNHRYFYNSITNTISLSHAMRPGLQIRYFWVAKSLFLTITFNQKKQDKTF